MFSKRRFKVITISQFISSPHVFVTESAIEEVMFLVLSMTSMWDYTYRCTRSGKVRGKLSRIQDMSSKVNLTLFPLYQSETRCVYLS